LQKRHPIQLLTSNVASEVLEARARVAAARERYEIALDRVAFLQTGEESLAVQAAGAAVRQAETAVAQAEAQVAQAEAMAAAAQAGVRAAEAERDRVLAAAAQAETAVSQAEKMVQQAQAALNLVDIQMEKQVVAAAVSGVIMTRSVEPGEIVMPGVSVMSIGQLDTLKVTVYIPENKYGQIHLGDSAVLTADSFPDRTFETVVTRISDQAEFTPRNVQTKEERQTTVYAVELSVQDDSGSLKPGMPVDVVFGN
jgi:multidrug resistance efflux pump